MHLFHALHGLQNSFIQSAFKISGHSFIHSFSLQYHMNNQECIDYVTDPASVNPIVQCYARLFAS